MFLLCTGRTNRFAERYRLAGRLLLLGHSVVLSMKEKPNREAGLS